MTGDQPPRPPRVTGEDAGAGRMPERWLGQPGRIPTR